MNTDRAPFQPPIPGMPPTAPASFLSRGELPGQPGRLPDRVKNILLIAAFVFLAAGLAVALLIDVQNQSGVAALKAQNKHLNSQVSTLKSKEHNDYTTNSGEITDLGQMLLPLATAHCSTDLTGPSGPTEYWFNCTAHNPQTTSQPSG